MDQQSHNPFVDLDNHESQTDAEALEAIRVAIGQSADFGTQPLSDVLHDQDQDGEHEQEHAHVGLQSQAVGSSSTSNNPVYPASQAEKTINELMEETQSFLWEIGTSDVTAFSDIQSRLEGNCKKQIRLITELRDMAHKQSLESLDPTLTGTHVLKSDYDELQAKYDELYAESAAATSKKGKKRGRQSTSVANQDQNGIGEQLDRETSSTPVDDKSRKKRSMKLEHLVHQQANKRLGIEYNVSKFISKGARYLPDPESTPNGPIESPNSCQEFRPNFRQDAKAPSVRPFIDQVVADVTEQWELGLFYGEPVTSHEKLREAVEVYWVRLAKRWNEQSIRAQGGIHKDEIVRRKQNQYRRQQSLVARRQAAFDQSPLNVCKLRSLYRTLLTLDFAPKTDERPNPDRAYTFEEWAAYRKSQYGSRQNDAHEVLDLFWLSPTARSILCILDVFATDQSARLKRKGKPKGPAPGFHLPAELWDRSSLPTLRPKDQDGLPLANSNGIILFRFHVDEKIVQEYPDWAEGLYDNPPIPESDNLLPSLHEVMNSNPYQHLKPIVKLTRESYNVRRFTEQEVEAINARPDEDIETTIGPILDAFNKSEPLQDLSNVNLDLSLDTLVNMTENQYMVPGSLDSQLANFESPSENGHAMSSSTIIGPGAPRVSLGTSVHARKMGKRTAQLPPGGAATPVSKRFKSEGQTMGESVYNEADEDLAADAGFLEEL